MSLNSTMPAAGRATRDPFNWPAQSRKDCMTLSSLDAERDLTHTRTKNFRGTSRDISDNLNTNDIQGKKPIVFIIKKVPNLESGQSLSATSLILLWTTRMCKGLVPASSTLVFRSPSTA